MSTKCIQTLAGLGAQIDFWAKLAVTKPRFAAADVDLIAYERKRYLIRQTGSDLAFGRAEPEAIVDDQQNAVGFLYGAPGTSYALLLDNVGAVAQAGRVDDVQRHAVNVDMLAKHVAGSACHVGNDRGLVAGESIQEARFARVRTPCDHQVHAVAKYLSAPSARQYGGELGVELLEAVSNIAFAEEIDLFVGKVDG